LKKVLITGATSGIGAELCRQFISKNYLVAGVGRRTERLESLQKELGPNFYYQSLDVTQLEEAEKVYIELTQQMGGLDIMILNAGYGNNSTFAPWKVDHTTINVNVMAFAHGCHWAFDYFKKNGGGQIVGMSSIASHLAHHGATAYTASKHFISNYMTGYRQKARRVDADITITDIRPGWVKSEMTDGIRNMFWVASTERACRQMIRAIESKRNRVYITRRWKLIAIFADLMPQWVWDRI
jgi:short-subunit dehydrogenase